MMPLDLAYGRPNKSPSGIQLNMEKVSLKEIIH